MDELFRYLQSIIKKNGPNPSDYSEFNSWVEKVLKKINDGSYQGKDLQALRKLWGDALSVETCQGLAFQKPRGYAGDFEMIDRLYTKYISPNAHLAKWDRFSQQQGAVQAVRNRPLYLEKVILGHLKKKKNLKILNIGSGPGRDMYYFFNKHMLNGSLQVAFDCIEQDPHAIAHARNLCHDFLPQIEFLRGNILRYQLTKKYDIIWASGIFDYFNDRIFVRMLKKLLPALKPNGECVVGNLSFENPTKNYLDILEWHLHYRTTGELKDLAGLSGAKGKKITVGREATGINLFLHIKNT
jgi:extracellular factor (EF) 3-hydroxypalmitic acid methyl ester biosynthesis protein